MAAICFRPPPLPPNKKSGNGGHFANITRTRKNSNGSLSSTYMSFRDPSEDCDIPSAPGEEIEMTELGKNGKVKRLSKVGHTNSLCRSSRAKVTLVRSHSDGNLDKKGLDQPQTINRYMRVLSGSWKNLLNCEYELIGGLKRSWLWELIIYSSQANCFLFFHLIYTQLKNWKM